MSSGERDPGNLQKEGPKNISAGCPANLEGTRNEDFCIEGVLGWSWLSCVSIRETFALESFKLHIRRIHRLMGHVSHGCISHPVHLGGVG